jgi:nucleoside-diphosphate-sugar epimerase
MTEYSSGDKLVIGCGYLGRRVALRWREEGCRVFVTTRSLARAAEFRRLGLEPVVCDVLDRASLRALPAVPTAVYCVGFDRAVGATMRQVYVVGLAQVVECLPRPSRFLYVSSTGVYGQADGEWLDEAAPTEPADEAGRTVLAAERLLRDRLPEAVVLRFAGIYGPGRLIREQALRAGQPLTGDPDKYLNLIHVEDGAAAVRAAAVRGQPGQVCNVCDDEPVRRQAFYECLANLLDAPEPHWVPARSEDVRGRHERGNRQVSNRKLRQEWGVALAYPTYRDGLRATIAARSPGGRTDSKGLG